MDVRSRNHVRVTGRTGGPVVVLAHGFGCDQNMWRLVVPLLEPDFTVVLFDHVGAGRSDPASWSERRCSTIDGHAEDVLEICHELALGPVTFVGHSVSAMTGVVAAAHEPDAFSGPLPLAPYPRFIDDPATGHGGGFSAEDIEELLESPEANHLGWSRVMAPVITGNPDRPELGEEPTDSFCRTDPDIARVTFLSDHRESLAHVRVPTLVARCSRDATAPPEVGASVRARIHGSRLITPNATGHCPQLAAPEETASAIAAFAGAGH